jgi:two-component system sensor histidine kinase YesM
MVTLSRRFSLAFILIVAVPSLIVSVALARLYLNALYDTVAKQGEATAEQVAQSIRGEIDSVSILASALVHDETLRSLADAYAVTDGRAEQYQVGRRLDDKLVSFFSFSNRIGSVVLFLRGGRVYTYSTYPNFRSLGLERSVVAEAKTDVGKVVLLDTLEGVGQNVGSERLISIVVAPPQEEPSSVEALLLVFRVPYFDALVNGPGGDGGPEVVIFGRSGKPLLSSFSPKASAPDLSALVRPAQPAGAGERTPGPGVDLAVHREVRAGERTWLATVRPLDPTGWTVALLSDTAALSRRVTRYQWYLYPALGLLAVLFMAYAELFFARIAVPVRAMIGHMGRVGKGDLDVRASSQPIRELAELADGFNRMVDETRRLQAERAQSERERLSAELDALRHQINPHFVANTLNSIRLMASAARADAIVGMTRDLMRVLSDSYASSGKLTELSREFDNVAAYVNIMKVRFGERFDLALDASPEAGRALALRMILQPIVENSILHGFAGGSSGAAVKARRGTIRIAARLEARDVPACASPEPWAAAVPGQALVVEVIDDGEGMNPARTEGILSSAPRRGGLSRIGVANVQGRIRLNFGPPYGLTVESEPGAFTRVTFLLPALVRAATTVAEAAGA